MTQEYDREALPRKPWYRDGSRLVFIITVAVLIAFCGVTGTTSAANYLHNRPDPHLLILDLNINVGQVTLNGDTYAADQLWQRVGASTGGNYTSQPVPVLLKDGDNQLQIDAPPFKHFACTIHVNPLFGPDQGKQVCQRIGTLGDGQTYLQKGTMQFDREAMVNWLQIRFGPADLTDAARADLQAAVLREAAHLPLTTTVPAGTAYATAFDATGKPTVATATQPLAARLQIDPASLLPDCGTYKSCSTAFSLDTYHLDVSPSWSMSALMKLAWVFSGSDGRPVATAAYPASVLHGDNAVLAQTVTYDVVHGGWSFANTPDLHKIVLQALCSNGAELVFNLSASHHNGFSLGYGGDLQATIDRCDPNISLNNHPFHIVVRYGVVFAGDAAAHALLPELPVAAGA